MHIFRSKLTKRYLLITLIVIFFVLASIYGVNNHVMNRSIQEQIEYRDDLIATSISKEIHSKVQHMMNDTRFASRYLLTDDKTDRAFYRSEMERRVATEPLYLFVQFFDEEGNVHLQITDMGFSEPVQADEIQERLSWSKTYYISDMLSLPDGRNSIAVAHPSVDEDGDYRGGVIAFLNLNTLSDLLSRMKIGEQGMNVVLDQNGKIIGHSNQQLVGMSLEDHTLARYLYKDRYGIWNGSLFEEEMIVAYRPLHLGGWGLIVGEPLQQAIDSFQHVKTLLLQGFMVVLLIAVLLTIFGTSRVVKPILSLIQQAKEYKAQRRTHFDPIQTNDELQDLSTTMGQMAYELTDKERRLFNILESIPYCVITTDQHGRVTTFNKGAEELTLLKRDEVIGKLIIDLPIKEHQDEFFSWKTLREGKSFEDVESYILDKNKKKYDVRLYSALFRDVNDQMVGALTIIRDVSDIKKLEEYVKQSERIASLGQLTAGVAHEIKNPLGIIHAAAEAIHLETEEQVETGQIHSIRSLADDILESSERMNGLLSDFLKLTKGEEDESKEEVDLISVLDELLHLLRKEMNDRSISVHHAYEISEANVYGDKNRLTQVFLNIIANSIQAMDGGGRLYVQVKMIPHQWQVIISDTGVGIPSSQMKWIFDPFFSTKSDGTGLGLSISHEIITQHHGEIWVDSVEGQGTTMYIQVPRVEQEEMEDETDLIG